MAETALDGLVKSKRAQRRSSFQCTSSLLPSANFTRSSCGTGTPSRRTVTVLCHGNGPLPGFAFGWALSQSSRCLSTCLSRASLSSSLRLPSFSVLPAGGSTSAVSMLATRSSICAVP